MRLRDGHCYVDATFGMGGHTINMLESCKGCYIIALDRDPNVFEMTRDIREKYKSRLITIQGEFSSMSSLLKQNNLSDVKISGILFDFGVSSYQLDTPSRGFSFRRDLDGPLDMRMNNDASTLSAYHIINSFSLKQLRDIMFYYGEEKHTKKVGEEIVKRRSEAPIETTGQAFRMFVNDETGEVQRGLREAETLLQPNGQLVAISFHSIEDRIVKKFLKHRNGHSFDSSIDSADPVYAQDDELDWNPRAKPAILRSAKRTSKPVYQDDLDASLASEELIKRQ
eukprot:gene17454-20827_t